VPRLRSRATLTGFAVAVLALAATGCASSTKSTGTSATGSSAPGTRFVGFASWYGQRHHGQATASGEVFDMNKMTAAHRTLPFGTRLKVTNVENGRSVVVRVNDRGPWVKDRVIDVSRAAGRALGMTGEGVARVEVVVLGAE
jgi:peptidoglycan lytic transglycosylase